jgi:NAD(P)H-hydrate epimerase
MPAVVDADALNALAQSPMHRTDWILTPHAGEAARLLAVTSQEIQRDRPQAASAIAERYGGVCVLKGAGTLVAAAGDSRLHRCDAGNPGMAIGGMGDVLTGVIAALVAQGLPLADAARAGVWVHATAGDRCAESIGVPGMLALDVCQALPQAVHDIAT